MWINTNESLPKPLTDVLFIGSGGFGYSVHIGFRYDGGWYSYVYDDFIVDDEVSFWMFVPEIPGVLY